MKKAILFLSILLISGLCYPQETVLRDIAWPNLVSGFNKWGDSCVYSSNCKSTISWGKPTMVDPNAEVSPMAPVQTEVTRAPWDLMGSFTGTSAGQQAVATDGNYIYTASWQSTPTGGYTFYKYDMTGNFIEGFNIAGATGIRDLTTDGQYFYGTSGSAIIFQLDLANKTLVSTINCSGLTSRHISYDPVRDGFWCGNWSTLALYSRTGTLIENGPDPNSAYGSAYFRDNNNVEHLYMFCQPNSDAKVYDFNITTGTINGPIFDYAAAPGYNSGIAGGCFIGDYNGMTAFFGNVQQDPNFVAIYELRESTTISQNFESGLGEWTVVDANNDGYTWCLTSAIPFIWTYYANLTLDWYHGGTNAICSGSYINGVGALSPDEYLISPQVSLGAGSQLSFWVAATDASYPADHFGVFVSTTGTNPSDFTSVQEWTLTAKREGLAGGFASRDGEGLRLGTWYNYTVNLSAYSGNAYIAFRHFNCYDQYIMCLDDIVISGQLPINYYSITAAASPANGGSVYGAGTYAQGSTCNLSATANSDYSFVKWTLNGTQVSTNPNYSFTVTGNASYVAHFQQNVTYYNISASANPTSGGTVTGAGTYVQGTTCNLQATANNGYAFVNWTKNGQQISTNPNYSFTVTGNETYVANFQLQSYTITASANPANGGTVLGAGTYNFGVTCNLQAQANNNYSFVKWTKNGQQVSTNPNYSFTVSENAEFVAHFEQNVTYYTITVTANPTNGGSVTGSGNYAQGTTCTIHATPNSGYSFVKWTKNGQQVSTNPYYSFTVTGNATYVAHFEQNVTYFTITATAYPSNGGTVTGGGSYARGSNCTLYAYENSGFSFVNWTKNGEIVSTNPVYSFTVTSNASYVAHFEQNLNNYVINATADPSEGGTVSGTGTYAEGSTCTLTAHPNDGWIFVNWTKNGEQVSTNPAYSFEVQGNASFVAHFIQSINHFTITAIAIPSNGGTITGSGTYEMGETCTLTATPNNGYQFLNWTDANGTTASTDVNFSFTVTSNALFVANFRQDIITYSITVTANPEEGGNVSGGGTYQEGANCILMAIPNEGWAFENWTENNNEVSANSVFSFTVTNNASYSANFSPIAISYSVTSIVVPAESGTVSGTGTYNQGSICTLVATPNIGYAFLNWTDTEGTVISTESTYSFSVTSNVIYVANFTIAANVYNITASTEPVDGGSVTGAGSYEEGETCTLIASPNDGFSFINWTENGMVVSTDNHYTFTVDSDRNIVANFFQGLFYTITATSSTGGTITPEGQVIVLPESDKTFNIIPDVGFVVYKVIVDGTNVGPVGSYTFRNVNADHSIEVQFSGLGVDDTHISKVKVYPNPTNNILNVQCQGMKHITLYNTLGQKVLEQEAQSNAVNISMKSLPKGVYLLQVMTQDGLDTIRIVKE